jgi:small-conductance mechanosensitive channel
MNAATFAVSDIAFLAVYLGISYLIILKYPQPIYIIVIATVILSVISMWMGVSGGIAESQTLFKTNSDLMYGLFGISILVGIAHYVILLQRFTVVESLGIAVLIMICLTPVNILLLKNKPSHS